MMVPPDSPEGHITVKTYYFFALAGTFAFAFGLAFAGAFFSGFAAAAFRPNGFFLLAASGCAIISSRHFSNVNVAGSVPFGIL